MRKIAVVTSLTLALSAGSVNGQGGNTSAGYAGPQLASPPFAELAWRNVGPTTMGGRVDRFAVARTRGQPDQIYVIATSGGVWKSGNAGASWQPVFGAVNGSQSMGDIAVAPSSPNTVWVGTGEATTVAYYWGDGIYKSTDAGRTWTNMGLKETRHIGRIVVHPTNPDIVLVAAQGRLWGPNVERGVFKTTDGGRTWRKVLYVDENTGANEVVFDPTNPQIVYASSYQRQRKSYGGITVGPGSGIYKSVDGGESWTKLTKGLPTVEMGRIGLDVSAADPKLLYADIEVGGARYPAPQGSDGDCPPAGGGRGGNTFEAEGGVYRSTDGGESWEQVNARLDQPAGYFVQVRADPRDRNRVYRMGLGFYVSDDMGRTFRTVATRLHGDYHDLWIDPADNNHLLTANDGGVGISWDRGASWDYRRNIPISQYWELNVDNRDPYLVCGGTQDNGNWCMPSAVRNSNGISDRDVWSVGGGDGMHFQVDPRDSNFAFIEVNSSTTTNSIQRLNMSTLQRQSAKPGVGRPVACTAVDVPMRSRAGALGIPRGVGVDPAYRWGWNTPVFFSSVRPGVVYSAANVLFKSTDRGGNWTPISPDLTSRVNRDTVFIMGKRVGTVNYSPGGGPSTNPLSTPLFGQIVWIGESPLNGRVLYTGSDDGQVQVTRDGGVTWTNVTRNVPGLPPLTFVSTVLPSRFAAGRVYATFDGHFNNDDNAYVYVSEDYGQSWRKIITGLPTTSVSRIAEHPRSSHLLVVGHAYGVHFSNDAGAHWQSLATNMPTVPVRSVVFQPRDNALVVGTYARGAWILDDAGPLEALTSAALSNPAVLVSITRGRMWNLFGLGPTYGVGEFYAPNPEFNPVISYYVRDAVAGNATITINDASGNRVRALAVPVVRGLNRVTWDMRMDSAIPGDAEAGGGGGGGGRGGGAGPGAGPLVLPGTYAVTVRIPGVSGELRGNATVSEDPLDRMSAVDRRARQDAIMRVYGLQKSLVTARTAAQTLVTQSDSIRLDVSRGGAIAIAQADSLTGRIARLRAETERVLGIAGTMLRAMENFATTPTADQRQHVEWASADAALAVTMLNRASQVDIPALYARHATGMKPRTVPPITP